MTRFHKRGVRRTTPRAKLATHTHRAHPGMKRRARGDALFSFGLVADVQAGDKPDSFGEGRCQRYDAAARKLGQAVDAWLAQRGARRTRHSRPALSFVLSLGDIVDGRDDAAKTMDDNINSLNRNLEEIRKEFENDRSHLHTAFKQEKHHLETLGKEH